MVVCSSVILCFSFHWSCWTDIEVGFVGLMFKRQNNEEPYGKSVTVTDNFFHKTDACFRAFGNELPYRTS